MSFYKAKIRVMPLTKGSNLFSQNVQKFRLNDPNIYHKSSQRSRSTYKSLKITIKIQNLEHGLDLWRWSQFHPNGPWTLCQKTKRPCDLYCRNLFNISPMLNFHREITPIRCHPIISEKLINQNSLLKKITRKRGR